jgi:hypothetical protein
MITMVSNGNIYFFFMTKFIIRHPLCGSFDCVLTHLKDLRFATYSYKSLMLVDHDLKSFWFGQGIPQKLHPWNLNPIVVGHITMMVLSHSII